MLNNFSWIISGNVFFGICQSLVVVLIAKFASAQVLGQFSFALAVTSPVVIFTRLNMRTFQATDASNEYGLGDYFYARLLSTLTAIAAAIILAFCFNFSAAISTLIVAVALFKSFESLSDIIYGRMQKEEWMSGIGKSQMLHGITLVAAIGLSLIVLQNLSAGVFLTAGAWLLLFFIYDLRIARNAGLRIEPSQWRVIKKLVITCFPFGITMMLLTLSTYIPSYFIISILGEKPLGFFSAIVYFMIFGGTVMTSLSQTVAPRLSKYYVNDNFISYRRFLLDLLGLSALAGTAGVAFAYFGGRWFLTFLYSAEYADYEMVFILIMAAAGLNFMGNFLGLSLTIARRLKEMVVMNLIAIISLIIFCSLLIPSFRLTGAAWAVVAGSLIKFAVSCWLNRKYIPINHDHVMRAGKNYAAPSSSPL